MSWIVDISPEAEKDLKWFAKHDKQAALKIADLIESLEICPWEGIGHPEPLKYALSGCWSRHINKKYIE